MGTIDAARPLPRRSASGPLVEPFRADHRGRPLWSRRWLIASLIALAILLATRLAHAELRGAPLPVTEAGCDVSVRLQGPIAHVTETHHLTAPGDIAALAAYDAALPRGAVVEGLVVRVAGRNEAGVIVPAESLQNFTPASLGLVPDLGTLRVDADPDDASRPVVDVRVYPVRRDRVTAFTLRWSVPATYADGLMSVVLPARGVGSHLAPCRVHLEASAGSGIRGWASLRAGGVWIGAGARVRGTVSGAPSSVAFSIEARPTWAGSAPVIAVAHAPPIGTSSPSTIAIYLPDTPTRRSFSPPRLLFIVDASRSVGEEGRRAAATLIETLVRAAPRGTPTEAVLFDRHARRVLGAWRTADQGAVAAITRAVREAPMASGSDLASALALAATTLGGEPGHVVVITDGVLPTGQSSTELLGAYAAPAGRTVIDILIPLVAGAAVPERGALATLASVYGGRVVAFPADHPMTPAALTDGLGAGVPITDLALDADGVPIADVALPDLLPAGAGIVLTTTLSSRPRRLLLRARRGKAALTARPIALPAGSERFAVAAHAGGNAGGPGALSGGHAAGPGALTGGHAAGPGALTGDDDAGAVAAAARRLGVVATGNAVLVIDRRSAGGAARHDLARRTGAVTFTPPPETLGATNTATRSSPTSGGSGAGGGAVITATADPRAGELPMSSVQLALRDQLVPKVRLCYREALRASPKLGGKLVVEIEIARGEVMAVDLGGDHFSETMIGCVADAAFGLTTPTYELGGQPDTVFVVRKPIEFRAPVTADAEPTVSLDDVLYPSTNPARQPTVEVEPDAPL